MREPVQIDRGDLLWKFYCKRYTIEGKEIPKPTNLCPYFWNSAFGFGMWLSREVRLITLWLGLILLTMLFLGLTWALPKNPNPITEIVFTITGVLWIFFIPVVLLISTSRLWRVLETRVPESVYLVAAGVLLLFLTAGSVFQGTFWSGICSVFEHLFHETLTMLIIVTFVILIMYVISKIPGHRAASLKRMFQTLSALIAAKKQRYCPPVSAPEDFTQK